MEQPFEQYNHAPVQPQPVPPQQNTPQPVPPQQPQYQAPVYPQYQVPVYQPAPQPRSPFADNPYVMNVPVQARPVQPPKPKKEKKPKNIRLSWGVVLLCLALVAASVAATAFVVNYQWQQQAKLINQSFNNRMDVLQQQLEEQGTQTPGTSIPQTSAPQSGLTPGQVYANNVRAVVAVHCTVESYDDYYGYGIYESFGSGFIISSDGYVVSNCHVVEDATQVYINTVDGEEYVAQVIGTDETNDISLLKIDGEDLPYVTLGSSDKLNVGDQVVAIGNPLGELTSTLTVGYVSAKDRIVTTDGTTINMLQTDAAINSGNSGGPLFNMKGEVIGITTAKYSGTTESGVTIEGIGFAIPVDDVIMIIEDLQEFGYVKGSYLGIYCRDVSADAIRDGLPAGVFVESVTDGYCAQAAGLQRQDIITELAGYKITCVTELTRYLRRIEPGTETTITVYRNGSPLVLSITLDEMPAPAGSQTPEESDASQGSGFDYGDFFGDYFG